MSRPARRRLRGLLLVAASVGVALLAAACATAAVEPEAEPELAALAEGLTVEVHRSQYCACCDEYEAYLRAHGAEVRSVVREDLPALRHQLGIPTAVSSCHTSLVDGYAVEGHVPLEVIVELLDERPPVDAIALPGMPAGSPGMGGVKDRTWTIYAVVDGAVSAHTTW